METERLNQTCGFDKVQQTGTSIAAAGVGVKTAAAVSQVPTPERLTADVRLLADLLGCSTRHIERLDVSGKLPAPLKLGRCKRWLLDGPTGIRAWLLAGAPDRRMWSALASGKNNTKGIR